MTDFRHVVIGSKTAQGTVVHIYGVAKDYVSFLNDKGDGKLFTERTDDVYLASNELAMKLSAEAHRKFSRAHQSDLVDYIGGCMARALQPGVQIADLKRIFKPLRQFIKDKPRIKKEIAKGPNPQHFVYLNHSNNASWTYSPNDDERLPYYVGEFSSLKHLAEEQLGYFSRRDVGAAIASGIGTIFRSTDETERANKTSAVRDHVERKVREYHHATFFISLLIISAVLCALGYFALAASNFGLTIWFFGLCGGLMGSFYSSTQRLRSSDFDTYQSKLSVLTQALSRSILGCIAGVLVVALTESGLALDVIRGNNLAILLAGFAGGFSERLVPDLISSVIK